MGEIAEGMLEGLFDYETGELIDGDAPGYPRKMMAPAKATKLARQAVAHLPFQCPECGRSFKHKGDLRTHRRDKSH